MTKNSNIKKGFTIIMVMVAMLLMLIMGSSLLALGYNSRLSEINIHKRLAAKCAADSGITKALHDITKAYNAGTIDIENLPSETDVEIDGFSGTYSYSLTGSVNDGFTITSIGKYDMLEKVITCNLELDGNFKWAIFTEEGFALKNSSQIIAYNLDEGETLEVGTNTIDKRNVKLDNKSLIDGNLQIGFEGEIAEVVDNKKKSTVTGTITNLSSTVNLDSVNVPQWLTDESSKGEIGSTTTISQSGKYDSINLKSGETLNVEGNVSLYITGDIDLGNSASISLSNSNPDSSLTIYLAGDLISGNSSTINNSTKDPTKLSILALSSSKDITLKQENEFYGVIYAPDTDITIHNSANYYGAFVANYLESKNSATFHYDASLDYDSIPVKSLVVKRWEEK